MPERKKRAAAYVRVSTDGQAEGTSLDTQEERILERAKKEGRTVWKEDVYVDVDSATLYERAALQKLLGACRSGWYDTVYVLRSDRMARSGLDQLNLLMKSGCQWRMLPADFPNWRTCYKYFRQWSERPGPGQDSILEQVLKKISWRGPTKQWTERADQLLYRGLPEREEHGHRWAQGL